MGTNHILRCLLFLLCHLCLLPMGRSIWLTLPLSGMKCVSEAIHTNIVVLADYTVVPDSGYFEVPKISAKIGKEGDKLCDFTSGMELLVTSPFGNILHRNENVTGGQFAFTTSEAGNYLACFWLDGHVGASVSIDWKIGIAAADWDSVARRERIQGIELELRKLEGAVDAIHENLVYLRSREALMREVSEITNSRVAWFSIMSLGVCTGVSALQLWHLKRYFQRKMVI